MTKLEIKMSESQYDLFIGIDAGTKTGFAVWNTAQKRFGLIGTLMIHEAMDMVKELMSSGTKVKVIVEDSRKRKWFGNADARQAKSGAGIREGIGSVKRDCVIWEDFLTDNKIDFEMVHPIKGGTKLSADVFKRSMKYEGRTSEHSRDAALLVYGRK